MKRYEIVIETFDEEFEVIEQTNSLEKAIEIVKKTPKEKYKAIFINQIGEDDRLDKQIEIEVR